MAAVPLAIATVNGDSRRPCRLSPSPSTVRAPASEGGRKEGRDRQNNEKDSHTNRSRAFRVERGGGGGGRGVRDVREEELLVWLVGWGRKTKRGRGVSRQQKKERYETTRGKKERKRVVSSRQDQRRSRERSIIIGRGWAGVFIRLFAALRVFFAFRDGDGGVAAAAVAGRLLARTLGRTLGRTRGLVYHVKDATAEEGRKKEGSSQKHTYQSREIGRRTQARKGKGRRVEAGPHEAAIRQEEKGKDLLPVSQEKGWEGWIE
ncbi:unnamed protein product [Calypogeia fissa]